jgi:hypothetical protein
MRSLYTVKDYLTRTAGSKKGLIFFDEATKKFVIAPEWHEDKYTKSWIIDSTSEEYIALEPYECLQFAIKLFEDCQGPSRLGGMSDIKTYALDLKAALQIAIYHKLYIANYYMAKVLELTDPKNSHIDKYYKHSICHPVAKYDPHMIAAYDSSRPWGLSTIKEDCKKAKEEYKIKFFSEIKRVDSVTLLRNSKKASSSEEKKAMYLHELGLRAENGHGNTKEALKFYLVAATYKKYISEDEINENSHLFPEFREQLPYLKKMLKKENDLQTRLDLIELYFALNDIYQYLYNNKDNKDEFVCKHEKNQTSRQSSFLYDLQLFAGSHFQTAGDLKSHFQKTAEESHFNAQSYVLFKGTQHYQDLRLKLHNCVNKLSDITLLAKAAKTFDLYLAENNNIAHSFSHALLDKHKITRDSTIFQPRTLS